MIGFSYVNMDEGYNGRRTCYFAILFEVIERINLGCRGNEQDWMEFNLI